MRVVTVPQALDDRSLDQLAAGLGHWPPQERLLIDAHATEWSSPAGFTALLTLGQALADANVPTPRLALPATDAVTSYWAKAGLLEHAAEYFELIGKVPRRKASEQSDVLVPVTAIRESHDVMAIIDRVNERFSAILREELGLPAAVVGGFSQALSETCQNITEHSGAGGWAAVHVYSFRRRLGRKVAVISVSDAGIGFRKSLEATQAKRFGDRWSDGTAIETALIHNVSRFRDPGRGQGLLQTKRYLGRWQGKISIRSGTARVAIAPPWDDEPPRTEDLPYFPGSQVNVFLPGPEAAE